MSLGVFAEDGACADFFGDDVDAPSPAEAEGEARFVSLFKFKKKSKLRQSQKGRKSITNQTEQALPRAVLPFAPILYIVSRLHSMRLNKQMIKSINFQNARIPF